MRTFSRRVTRFDAVRTAALFLGACAVLGVAAYGFAAVYSTPTPGGLVAAVVALGVAGSGLLYAWRPGTGGLGD
jgi:hypothetical protein